MAKSKAAVAAIQADSLMQRLFYALVLLTNLGGILMMALITKPGHRAF